MFVSTTHCFMKKSTPLQQVTSFLNKKRYVCCSDTERQEYNIPSFYKTLDLLNIKEFCIYVGGMKHFRFSSEEIQDIKYWTIEGMNTLDEIQHLITLMESIEKTTIFTIEVIENSFLDEKLSYYNFIFDKLNDIVIKKRNEIKIPLQTRINISLPSIPPYLATLIELYVDETNQMSITIAEFSVFLAKCIQNNFPFTMDENQSIHTVLQASQNKKYPLYTLKHLSYRIFFFLSSVPEFKHYTKDESFLNEKFNKR